MRAENGQSTFSIYAADIIGRRLCFSFYSYVLAVMPSRRSFYFLIFVCFVTWHAFGGYRAYCFHLFFSSAPLKGGFNIDRINLAYSPSSCPCNLVIHRLYIYICFCFVLFCLFLLLCLWVSEKSFIGLSSLAVSMMHLYIYYVSLSLAFCRFVALMISGCMAFLQLVCAVASTLDRII